MDPDGNAVGAPSGAGTSATATDAVVVDVGGTTLRIGRVPAGTTAVRDVLRVPLDGLDSHPGASAAQVQPRVLDQIAERLAAYLGASAGVGAAAVGVAFAGPVSPEGVVTAAPTVWGAGGAPVHLGQMLGHVTHRPILVANDMAAAVWRYAEPDSPPFCLLTVSSGIGSKVYRDGEVLLDAAGYGGELGHWRVDLAPDAPLCDCGGRGHLGAVASGRGILAAARRAGSADPHRYAASMLAVGAPDPATLTNEMLAAALRAGDEFAAAVLQPALLRIAQALSGLYCAIGIRRFIVIGGFALAVGQPFADGLTRALVEVGCFDLSPGQIGEMVSLGAADDDDGLIGMARLLARAGRRG